MQRKMEIVGMMVIGALVGLARGTALNWVVPFIVFTFVVTYAYFVYYLPSREKDIKIKCNHCQRWLGARAFRAHLNWLRRREVVSGVVKNQVRY